MSLLRQELNLSLAAGEHKHDLLNHLLALLKDKGIIYDQHNGADLSLYSPLYRVSLYHSQSMKHITDLVPALLLNIPGVELPEFYHLTHLACNPHTAVVRGIVLSHIPKHRVKDPTHLNAAVVRAFGEEEAELDLHAEVAEDAILSPVVMEKLRRRNRERAEHTTRQRVARQRQIARWRRQFEILQRMRRHFRRQLGCWPRKVEKGKASIRQLG